MRAGTFEMSSLLRFFSSVSTRFSISFQNHHYFLPNFNRASLIVFVWLIWVIDFVLNCSVELEREGLVQRVRKSVEKVVLIRRILDYKMKA